MKTNKLAAGALALALGLGAVAPTVAQAKEYTASQLFLMDHKEVLAEANELFPKYNAAREKRAAADKEVAVSKKLLKEAEKKFYAVFPELKSVDMGGDVVKQETLILNAVLKRAQDIVVAKTETDAKKYVAKYKEIKADKNIEDKKAALIKYLKEDNTDKIEKPATMAKYDYDAKIEVLADQIMVYVAAEKDMSGNAEYKAYVAAQYRYSVAIDNQKKVYAETKDVIDDYIAAEKKLEESAARFNVTVQVGNDGFKLVNKDDKKVEAAEKKSDKLARLKAVKENAEESLRAAKLLLELAPATVKPVEAKLNDLVKKQEALIEKANKELKAEKVAFIATAYADDASADEVDSLIKELEDNTKEIQDTIKGNEEKVVEENKKEEKKEDKKEEAKEDKKEDKKEEKTPAKKAGNNVKTGIAGVAGVAGILAAAATAYAATKRD